MKLHIETKPMTQAEAEAGQKNGRRLATASEVFEIPTDQWNKECYPHTPLRIENGLLARSFYALGYDGRRYVNALDRPSHRFGVLYVLDEKPCEHRVSKPKGTGIEDMIIEVF